jgi:fumarate hydratase subunit alpha
VEEGKRWRKNSHRKGLKRKKKMRNIDVRLIKSVVKELCIKANYELPREFLSRLESAIEEEHSSRGREVLRCLLENAYIAKCERRPLCQDTGVVNVFITCGNKVKITGGDLYNYINQAVKEAYVEEGFRKSVVRDPLFSRENTNTNSPAAIYFSLTKGEKVKITVLIKGGGSDNASTMKMFTPTSDSSEIEKFVIDVVEKNGVNACPPLIIGIGIGGGFASVPLLAKKALLRGLYKYNSDKRYAKLEKHLERVINSLGLGPLGLGGKITALKVNIEVSPCHIASLPVSVELQCHAFRTATKIL